MVRKDDLLSQNLPAIGVRRKDGSEPFHAGGNAIGKTLRDFWSWTASDPLSNALRGQIAEFLVACALGVDDQTRAEWDAYDVEGPNGVRVEVKSSAYL